MITQLNSSEKAELNPSVRHGINTMLCAVCGWTEVSLSDIKGYEEMCDDCAAEKMCRELEEEWENELSIYEKRTGEKLDFHEFYYKCLAGNVNIKKLAGLKELKSCYYDAKAKINYLNKPIYGQIYLDFEQNNLPF